jgi:hypothetical protein
VLLLLLFTGCCVWCSTELHKQVLIDTLAQSKVTFNNIERKVKEAAKTQEIIARTRRGYAPVAFRASQLFFCIADLGSVDPMYQVTANLMYPICLSGYARYANYIWIIVL